MEYEELSNEIEMKKEEIIDSVMNCIYGSRLSKLKQTAQYKKSKRDLDYILSYLSEAVYFNNSLLFEDFSFWLRGLFININLGEDVFKDTYQCIMSQTNNYFPKEQADYLQDLIEKSMQSALDESKKEISYIKKDNPQQVYAEKYLQLLLNNDKRKATELIIEDVLDKIEISDIYLNIFQPVQKEVGRLWHQNQVSVAQEHYVSSVTQLIMSQLYPHFLTREGRKGKIVTTAVGNELHEIGIRMIADLLEISGYDTIHLGANTPNFSIAETLEKNNAQVLGVSVTLPIHLKELDKLVKIIKEQKGLSQIKILVGGYVFNNDPKLYKEFAVDDYSINAKDAVRKVDKLIGADN